MAQRFKSMLVRRAVHTSTLQISRASKPTVTKRAFAAFALLSSFALTNLHGCGGGSPTEGDAKAATDASNFVDNGNISKAADVAKDISLSDPDASKCQSSESKVLNIGESIKISDLNMSLQLDDLEAEPGCAKAALLSLVDSNGNVVHKYKIFEGEYDILPSNSKNEHLDLHVDAIGAGYTFSAKWAQLRLSNCNLPGFTTTLPGLGCNKTDTALLVAYSINTSKPMHTGEGIKLSIQSSANSVTITLSDLGVIGPSCSRSALFVIETTKSFAAPDKPVYMKAFEGGPAVVADLPGLGDGVYINLAVPQVAMGYSFAAKWATFSFTICGPNPSNP